MIAYRTKRKLQSFGIFLLILLLVLVVVWLVWMFWLDRYVVYTRDGAKLLFSQPFRGDGVVAAPPEAPTDYPIYYNDGKQTEEEEDGKLAPLYGYYADVDMLRNDMDTVISQVKKLPPKTAVMIDVKDITGKFYYSTALDWETDSRMDIAAMDELIELLNSQNLYAIARVPAFRDRLYGLANVPDGLYHTSRLYLWMDDNKCYWLNPNREGTLAHLMEIVLELKTMGFDEVVFSDFRFPDTEDIYFPDSKEEALQNAATKLRAACATDEFAVSFVSENGNVFLPEGRTRLYISDTMDAAELGSFAAGLALENPEGRLVFFTESRDTRFEQYGVLHPITGDLIPKSEQNPT